MITNELTVIRLAREIVKKVSRSCSFTEFKGRDTEFNKTPTQSVEGKSTKF